MKLEDSRKIADDLASWGGGRLKVISIIGLSEPQINRETPRMVGYLKELDVSERRNHILPSLSGASMCYSLAISRDRDENSDL